MSDLPANLELEAQVLGMMLAHNETIDTVADLLIVEDFSEPLHQRIYASALSQHSTSGVTNPATLHALFKDDPAIKELGGAAYLMQLTANQVGLLDPKGLASQLADTGRRRRIVEGLKQAIEAASDAHCPIGEAIGFADDAISEKVVQAVRDQSVEDCFDQMLAGYGQQERGVTCGRIKCLDELMGGLKPGSMNVIAARPGMGKAQPLTAKVLTPSGWRLMGELQVGDEIASPSGERSIVTGIFPQGQKEIYRVTLSDGRSTECCADHLWSVMYRGWDAPRVLTTAKIQNMLSRKRYHGRLSVDTFQGDFGSNEPLPIDPWLLGFLLGDGSICGNSLRFSTNDPEIVSKVGEALPPNLRICHAGNYDYRISRPSSGGRANVIMSALRQMGLGESRSHDKFIPEVYLRANRSARMELLRGLMDSDGWAEKSGAVRFATASERLADQVCYLVRSLGGICSVATKAITYTYKGEKKVGRDSYVCKIRMNNAAEIFSLNRKADRARRVKNYVNLNISSVEALGISCEMQCISVSHPSHLYVTDDFIVTHNTAVALSYAIGAAEQGHGVLLVSLEMPGDQLAQRMAADLLYDTLRVPYERIRDGRLDQHERQAIMRAKQKVGELPLRIATGSSLAVGRLASLIRRTKRRFKAHGGSLDLVMVDYLQLLRPDVRGNRYEAVTEISMALKAMAMANDVAMIALAQLSRAVEQREDKRPMLSDLRESGQLEQDADLVLFLLREEYYLRKEEPPKSDDKWADWQMALAAVRDQIKFIVAKRRNGVEGVTVGKFYGEFQAVRG